MSLFTYDRLVTHLACLLPHLGVLPAEDPGVEITVALVRGGLRIGPPAYLDALPSLEGDPPGSERIIEGVQV